MRPSPTPSSHRPCRQVPTTPAGRMIELEVRLRVLGRALEPQPGEWHLARRAFGAASEVRALRGVFTR